MPTHVYANNNEIASKASEGKSIAAFPDVCFSPPAPPVGPMPLPYPNTGEATNTDKGTSKVFIKDKMSGMVGDSVLSKSTGDESATKNFNKGFLNASLQGECHFRIWSMNVKAEGKEVPRHTDMITHNHACFEGNACGTFQASFASPDVDGVKAGGGAHIKNKYCCDIYIIDHKNYYVSPYSFKGYKNQYPVHIPKISIVSFSSESKGEFYKCNTMHLCSGVTTIYIDLNDTRVGSVLYSSFEFKNTKPSVEVDRCIDFKINDNGMSCSFTLEYENKSVAHCKSHNLCYEKIGAVIKPTPHFPRLISGGYDKATAKNLAKFSAIAYGTMYQDDKDKAFSGSLRNMAESLLAKSPKFNISGFNLDLEETDFKDNFTYCKEISAGGSYCCLFADNKKIIIAFRGTQLFDSKGNDVKADLDNEDCEYCCVNMHKGFLNYFNLVEALLVAELNMLGAKDKEIYITGHSMGGAIAFICASYLKIEYKYDKVFTYTFAMPAALSVNQKTTSKELIKKIENIPLTRVCIDNDEISEFDYLGTKRFTGKKSSLEGKGLLSHTIEEYIELLEKKE